MATKKRLPPGKALQGTVTRSSTLVCAPGRFCLTHLRYGLSEPELICMFPLLTGYCDADYGYRDAAAQLQRSDRLGARRAAHAHP